MSFFQELSKIDERTKYTVYGWLRELENELKIETIPDIITTITILYYRKCHDLFHGFDANRIKVSKDGACIAALTKGAYDLNNYGKIAVLSTDTIKCRWDVRVQFESRPHYVIGISTSTGLTGGLNGICYCFMGWGRKAYKPEDAIEKLISYGTSIVCGDKVSICLDLTKKEVSFMINDVDYGVAFEDIEQKNDMKYRLMVQMADKGMSVEMVDFEEHEHNIK